VVIILQSKKQQLNVDIQIKPLETELKQESLKPEQVVGKYGPEWIIRSLRRGWIYTW